MFAAVRRYSPLFTAVFAAVRGLRYNGEFKAERRHGKGTMEHHHPKENAVYDSEWAEGEFCGYGTYTWPDNRRCGAGRRWAAAGGGRRGVRRPRGAAAARVAGVDAQEDRRGLRREYEKKMRRERDDDEKRKKVKDDVRCEYEEKLQREHKEDETRRETEADVRHIKKGGGLKPNFHGRHGGPDHTGRTGRTRILWTLELADCSEAV